MSADTAALALPGVLSYWKLGTNATDTLLASTGTSVASPAFTVLGHIFGETNGGDAFTSASSGSKYVRLGRCSTMMADLVGTGMTFATWFLVGAIPATAGPHYVCGGYDATTKTGWHLSINNANTFNQEGFTLSVTAADNTTYSRTFKRPVGLSFLADGQWHHICVRILLSTGASSSAGTMSVAIDGITMRITSNFSGNPDVAVDATVGTFTNLATGYFTLGCRDVAGTPSTVIDATYQRAFQCRGLISDSDLIGYLRQCTNTANVGPADCFAEFVFTDITKLFQDTAGTTPVTTIGQTVRRVNATNFTGTGTAWYLTSASVGTSPVWNGTDVECLNYGGSALPWRGWAINGPSATNFFQWKTSALAVVSPLASDYTPSGGHTICAMTNAGGGAFVFGIVGDRPAVYTGTVGTLRSPSATPSEMEPVKCEPTWTVIAGSTGSNGSGGENDGNDFVFVCDDTVRGNAAAGGAANNGAYYNVLTGPAWAGAVDAVGNAGLAAGNGFSGRWRKMCIYNRPIHRTAEAPYIAQWTRAAYPDMIIASKTRVVVVGDSIPSGNNPTNSTGPMGGFMTLIGSDFTANTVVQNAGFGGTSVSQTLTRIDSAKWAANWPTSGPRLVVVMCGTNNMINSANWTNEATLQSDFSSLISTIRTRFGASVPIVVIPTRLGLDGASAGNPNAVIPTTALFYAYLQANTNLYTRLCAPIAFTTVDGTHPDRAGQIALAALLRTAAALAQPAAFGSGGGSRGASRIGRINRISRVG